MDMQWTLASKNMHQFEQRKSGLVLYLWKLAGDTAPEDLKDPCLTWAASLLEGKGESASPDISPPAPWDCVQLVEKQFENTKRKAHEAGAEVEHEGKREYNLYYNLNIIQARKSSAFAIAEILSYSSKMEVLSGENTFPTKQPR